jgi:plastocyanin
VGVAGCGGDGGGDGPAAASSSPAQSTGGGDSVEIAEFQFEPEEITVPAGTSITFTNRDAAAHTATADDSSFDTEELGKGDSARTTFNDPGTYPYYCRFHVFMKGSVVVE